MNVYIVMREQTEEMFFAGLDQGVVAVFEEKADAEAFVVNQSNDHCGMSFSIITAELKTKNVVKHREPDFIRDVMNPVIRRLVDDRHL